jgi:5'-3' exonuclease
VRPQPARRRTLDTPRRPALYAGGVSPPEPLLLVVDGNSLLHRAYHAAATGELHDGEGRAVWALKGLVTHVAHAAARLRPDAVLVGFDCPVSSTRADDYAGYKAHRPAKPADLQEQLVAAPDLLRAAGLPVVVPAGYEADDVLASCAAKARDTGWRTVLVTSDRDAFALLDASTSVLRIRNGGRDAAVLVRAATLPVVCGVEAWQYRDFAALRGDPSDNLDGVPGFGPATAADLLAAFGTVDAAWAALDGGRVAEVSAAVGARAAERLAEPAAREVVVRNRRLMRMRTDLPVPDLEGIRLPLEFSRMRRALAGRGILLGPSLWALTGGVPPDEVAEAPEWVRVAVRPPRSRRPSPIPGQLTLF